MSDMALPDMPALAQKAFTVTEVNNMVQMALAKETRFASLLVEGEITDCRPYGGNYYFSLKDAANSKLACTCWKSVRLSFVPANGMSVLARGKLDVYMQRGVYQLNVTRMEPAGLGALMLAVQERAERLRAEGIFDDSRKRRIPRVPKKVAIVTSLQAAALRDVYNVIRRRSPKTDLLVIPTLVQGETAPAQLVLAIQQGGRCGADTLLLVRGGGSYEDLAAFQDEAVVRAIAACPVPVITGIGHETDTTLADFAADRRAPTPSAAAELAVPETASLAAEVSDRERRLRGALLKRVQLERQRLHVASQRLERCAPMRLISGLRQELHQRQHNLEMLTERLVAMRRRTLDTRRLSLSGLSPANRMELARSYLLSRNAALARVLSTQLAARRQDVERQNDRLAALSPLAILARGYTVTREARDGKLLTSLQLLQPRMELETVWHDGTATSVVSALLPKDTDPASTSTSPPIQGAASHARSQ